MELLNLKAVFKQSLSDQAGSILSGNIRWGDLRGSNPARASGKTQNEVGSVLQMKGEMGRSMGLEPTTTWTTTRGSTN
jgi:hypothetical protein